MNNKAQVSIFIILGSIMLIAAGLIFFTSTIETEDIAPEVLIAAQIVPVELDPLANFITECLDDTSTRGLKLIGEHGGYIDPDNAQLIEEYSMSTLA